MRKSILIVRSSKVRMSNFNTCKSNTVLIIVIVATCLTEVITVRQAEVLVNESAFISCFSKEVKNIQWHHTPPGKNSNKYVYAGGRFYHPYNTGRFQVDNDPTTNIFTLIITNVMHEDAGLYECKEDVLSGVFGSNHLTVLDSNPVCTSNVNPNGFVGPNTCNFEQENMTFSCAVSFSGNSPNLVWSTLNGYQASNTSICERKDNRINCSLSMKADPSFDGSTFICQTTTSNNARHNCSIEDIRVEYFIGDYEAAEKRVGDTVTCVVASNLQIYYNWTIQQNNQDNILNTNGTIYFQKPGFYKCSVKYNIRDVTCYASIVAANVSNIVHYQEPVEESSSVSTEQSKAPMIAVSIAIGVSMCLVAVIALVIYKKCIKGRRVSSDVADTTSQKSECLLPLIHSTTPEKNNKEFTEEMKIQLTDRMNRLLNVSDFLCKECIEDVKFLWPGFYEETQRKKVANLLATLGVTKLFIEIWKKYFEMDFLKDASSLLYTLMHDILWVLCNSMESSTELCVQVFEGDLHKVVLNYLKTDYLDRSKTVVPHCEDVVRGLMRVLHNMLQNVLESSQSLREQKAFDVFQRFREGPSHKIGCLALILQAYIITEEESESVNSEDPNFIFLKYVLETALKSNNSGGREDGFSPIEVISALNRLAVNDNNKIKIVNAGLLPFYVKLLQPQCSEKKKEAAAEGLWTLAFECTHEIKNEPGCVIALIKLAEGNSERLKRLAEGVLWTLENSQRKIDSLGKISRTALIKLAEGNSERLKRPAEGVLRTLEDSQRKIDSLGKISRTALIKLAEVKSDRLKRLANGVLWTLEDSQRKKDYSLGKISRTGRVGQRHVFISYQWDSQPMIKKLVSSLKMEGFQTWVDYENTCGSILEAMARAVEEAAVVVICLSQKYKQTPNCRTEVEYTFRMHKDIIPLRLQSDYSPDGWLGVVIGNRLMHDFTSDEKYSESIKNLVRALGVRGKAIDYEDGDI